MFDPADVKTLKVLVHWDYPRLFLCEDNYIACSIKDTFMYTQLSQEDYKEVWNSWPEKPSRKLFSEAETIYVVDILDDGYRVRKETGEFFKELEASDEI